MSCGNCPIGLICHAGLLKRLTLCPLCGVLQVIIVDVHGTNMEFGVETLRIECSRRRINSTLHHLWWMDYAYKGKTAWVRVKDTGPWQINNVSSKEDIGLLTVSLCRQCVVKGRVW